MVVSVHKRGDNAKSAVALVFTFFLSCVGAFFPFFQATRRRLTACAAAQQAFLHICVTCEA